MTALISRRFAQQNPGGPQLQVGVQTVEPRIGAIEIAVVEFVALGPGVKDVPTAAGPKQAKEGANFRPVNGHLSTYYRLYHIPYSLSGLLNIWIYSHY